MLDLQRNPCVLTLALIALAIVNACSGEGSIAQKPSPVEPASAYSWTKVTDGAAFPASYNFPVFAVRNQMWAFHGEGNWSSSDGKTWQKSELPSAGLNSAYQKYVPFKDAVYALGTMEGNYQKMRLGSRISRTSDFKSWEVLAEQSELPARVFYGAAVFQDKIWMFGGWDGKRDYNDVWHSGDGVKWTRVQERAAWAARSNAQAVVFNNKIWLIGGGVFEGQAFNEVWSSADGINWTRATDKMSRTPIFGYSPIAFDGKLWLVGANRDGVFTSGVLVSNDGATWREETAPWSPRGGVATWIKDDKLYLTGGKYSVTENGEIKFIYSNDVWYMAATRK